MFNKSIILPPEAIAEAHGDCVRLDSHLDMGSKFTLILLMGRKEKRKQERRFNNQP
jgi:hypothetical protein